MPIRAFCALLASSGLAAAFVALTSCTQPTEVVEVTVPVEVTREVPVTVSVDLEVVATVEVPVTVEVDREVVVTREVEVTREVDVPVPVTVQVVREVPVTVEVEATRRIEVAVTRVVYLTREIEVTRETEVTREVPVTVIVEKPTPTPTPTTIVEKPTPTPTPTTTVEKPTPTPTPTVSGLTDETLDDLTNMMLKLINDEREEEGLSPLSLSDDSAAQIAAQKHAEDMMTRCYLRHHTGRTSHWDRYILAGGDEYRYRLIAENIAVQGIELGNLMTHDPSTGETWRSIRCLNPNVKYFNVSIHGHLSRVHGALMDSPVHRDNILDPEFEEVALGFAWKYPALWVVQLFFAEN